MSLTFNLYIKAIWACFAVVVVSRHEHIVVGYNRAGSTSMLGLHPDTIDSVEWDDWNILDGAEELCLGFYFGLAVICD